MMEDPQPMEVRGSPLVDQLWTGLRQFAPAAMTYALGRGWLTNELAILLGVAGGVIWPIIAGQLKTRRRAQQLTYLACAVQDDIAVVK